MNHENILKWMGQKKFQKEKIWECTTKTCASVALGYPCRIKQEDNPTGECIMYPKKDYPDLPHYVCKYKLL